MELLDAVGRGLTKALAEVEQYNASLTAGTFTVNKDNVLAAAKIIQTQAQALEDKLDYARRDLRVAPPGEDDISTRVAPAWNDLLVDRPDSYASRIDAYIQALYKLAQQCGESARAYGYTDEQVAAVFGATGG